MGDPAGRPVELETDPKPGDIHLLEQRINEFNVQTTGIADGKLLAPFLRDGEGMVLGGAFGWTWGAPATFDIFLSPPRCANADTEAA